MLLLVGLGNPDTKYQANRHNVGFQIIDTIAEHFSFSPERKKFQGLIREGTVEGDGHDTKVLLLKPQTFYNESGNSVREAVSFFKIPLENLYVFHDELDLAPGKIKVKRGGSTAGNNGLKSISAHVGPDFHRVRIGIGHPGDKAKVTGHVLSDFSRAEKEDWLDEMKEQMARHVHLLGASENGTDRFLSAISANRQAPARTKEKAHSTQSKPAPQTPSSSHGQEQEKQSASPFDKLKSLLGRDQKR